MNVQILPQLGESISSSFCLLTVVMKMMRSFPMRIRHLISRKNHFLKLDYRSKKSQHPDWLWGAFAWKSILQLASKSSSHWWDLPAQSSHAREVARVPNFITASIGCLAARAASGCAGQCVRSHNSSESIMFLIFMHLFSSKVMCHNGLSAYQSDLPMTWPFLSASYVLSTRNWQT